MWWISGFLTLYCNFELSANLIAAAFGSDQYVRIFRHYFTVGFNITYLPLIKVIADTIGLNYYERKNHERVDITAQALHEASNLCDFFDKYPPQSNKNAEYEIWREFVYSEVRLRYFEKLIDQLKNLNQ